MHFCARQQWAALALGAVLLSLSAVTYLKGPAPATRGPATAVGQPGRPALPSAQDRALTSAPAPVPAASTALPVDVNRASAAELEAVPGIGPVLAQRILALRAERGRFASLAELKQVKGIKDKRLARLAPYLTLGQGSSG